MISCYQLVVEVSASNCLWGKFATPHEQLTGKLLGTIIEGKVIVLTLEELPYHQNKTKEQYEAKFIARNREHCLHP